MRPSPFWKWKNSEELFPYLFYLEQGSSWVSYQEMKYLRSYNCHGGGGGTSERCSLHMCIYITEDLAVQVSRSDHFLTVLKGLIALPAVYPLITGLIIEFTRAGHVHARTHSHTHTDIQTHTPGDYATKYTQCKLFHGQKGFPEGSIILLHDSKYKVLPGTTV